MLLLEVRLEYDIHQHMKEGEESQLTNGLRLFLCAATNKTCAHEQRRERHQRHTKAHHSPTALHFLSLCLSQTHKRSTTRTVKYTRARLPPITLALPKYGRTWRTRCSTTPSGRHFTATLNTAQLPLGLNNNVLASLYCPTIQ